MCQTQHIENKYKVFNRREIHAGENLNTNHTASKDKNPGCFLGYVCKTTKNRTDSTSLPV